MKRVTAVLTALVLMLSLTACGVTPNNTPTGDNALVGTWKGEIDYAGVINAVLATDETLAASGVQSNAAPVGITYVFDEDGKVTCSLDQEALYAALQETAKEILKPMIEGLMGQDIDTYLQQAGMAGEEMMKSLFPNGFIEQVEKVFAFSGAYTFEGDVLSVLIGKQALKSAVELGDGTLTFKEPVGVNVDNEAYRQAVSVLYPLVLTKA